MPMTIYVSAFLSTCSSSAPSPSSPSPAVSLLESKNARSDFFSGSSNVPLCADTYVCNNLQPEYRKVFSIKEEKRYGQWWCCDEPG